MGIILAILSLSVQNFFYISMVLYPILVSADKNVLEKKLKFCTEPR